MPFERFVQIGRVALINYGDDEGKLCTIIDVVDQGRALIDGPTELTGVTRQIIPMKRLSLTDFVVTNGKHALGRNSRQKALKSAWEQCNILAKWEATSWAKKKSIQKKRASNNDFARFKAMVLRKKRSKLVKTKARSLA